MTVCTNHVAGGDLVEDGLPGAVAEAFGDADVMAACLRRVAFAM
jgi:hypothetical protein